RPGRQAGSAYGRKACRAIPAQVDRTIDVPLPPCCPHCGGPLEEQQVAEQYQEELPEVRPEVTRFQMHVGRCQRCGRRVQGRHPEQTSDALGAAKAQLGPRAVALAAQLNKAVGASLGKTATILQQLGGLEVTRGGLSQALARAGRMAGPTYDALIQAVRASPVVAPDETGWKVGGRLHWLWVFSGQGVTVYSIQPGRGFDEAAAILGKEFNGVLERDGWAPYRRFSQATHQTCTAHLMRRCRQLLTTAHGRAREIPLAVRRLLREGLDLRQQRDAGSLPVVAYEAAVADVEHRVDRLLAKQTQHPGNRRLLQHLRRERQALFTYLHHEGVQATNWRAEQAIHPAVVNRKVWGGNRTPAGVETQQVLASLLRTCHQQGRDSTEIIADLLRAPLPLVAPLQFPIFAGHA